MFDGFLTKAKQSNELFEQIANDVETLDELIEEDDSQQSKIKCEEWSLDEDFEVLDDTPENSNESPNLDEVWINSNTLCIEPAGNNIESVNLQEECRFGSFLNLKMFLFIFYLSTAVSFEVEFLDQENEIPDNSEENELINDESLKSTASKKNKKGPPKRYAYRCNQCKKRFVYKDVYEAHLRTHQGLPGWK